MKETTEIHEWECPKCKKIIKSIYEGQFDINKKRHLDKHKRNNKK